MENPESIDTGWKIHSALTDWTGKVDAKASFTLAVESAVLAGVIQLAGSKRRLNGLEGASLVLFWVGVGLLIASVLAVAWVVRPRLRWFEAKTEAPNNFIYFGHLRHWKPIDLEAALKNKELLPVLSRQLVNMSKIAWSKHWYVQLSLTGAALGTGLVGLAAALHH